MIILKHFAGALGLAAIVAAGPGPADAKGGAGARPGGKPAASQAFNKAAATPRPKGTIGTTGAARPAPKSLAPTSLKFNRSSGAVAPPRIPMHISRSGRIVPDSRVPRFNAVTGAPPRPLPPLTSISTGKGQSFAVPKGANGPVMTRKDKGKGAPNGGVAMTGGTGKVSTIRVMPPTAARGKSPAYPHGYITYSNKQGQTVNPRTGQPVKRNHPAGHIPIRP